MRYERVKVTRDPHTVYNRPVLPWEIAILEFTFEEGNVVRTGVFERNSVEYPDPKMEFQRLVLAYGSDPQSGVPFVASVYGEASAGVNRLRHAIAEAKAEDEAESSKPVSKTRKRRVAADVAADPLMA